MTGWAPKRFWKEAQVLPAVGGFAVHLDGRPVKTPAKAALILPNRAMAEAVAAEWNAQDGVLDPETMPCTRAANSALDKLSVQRAEVAAMLAAYGGSDLLCYRATRPQPLIERQAAAWTPLLDWAAAEFGAPLVVTPGVMPTAQPEDSLARLAAQVDALDPFRLAAFHDLVAISGSLVLALAVIRGRIGAEEAWAIARLDETWQIEQWGEDEAEAKAEAYRRAAFLQADRFFRLCA